jgi:type IV pilus assembly protein PilF
MKIIRITGKLFPLLLIAFLVSCGGSQPTKQKPQEEGPDLKQAAKLNVQLAIGYIKRNNMETAKEKLEKAIEQDSENTDAYKTLAYLYSQLGMNTEANAQYQKAIDIKSNDPDLHNNYGTFLCKIGRVDEALTEFKAAYTNPFYETSYLAHANAGACLLKQERYVEAETMLRKALHTDPNLASALISMADLGIKTKQYLKARAYIQRYHEKNKASPESLWIQVRAEKALGDQVHYLKFARQLVSEFPESDEASWVQEQARNEQLRNK